jgi:hypothetical protein
MAQKGTEMVERAKNAKAQIKLRLLEPMRARLERDAKEYGHSLNFEILRRLDQSIKDDDLGKILFGDHITFHYAYVFTGIIRALEGQIGKKLSESPDIFEMAVDAFKNNFGSLVSFPGLIGLMVEGREVGGTRVGFEVAAQEAIKRRAQKDSSHA